VQVACEIAAARPAFAFHIWRAAAAGNLHGWTITRALMLLGPLAGAIHSYETHAGRWLGFRQPVRRVAMERTGRPVTFTYEANPGEVWEDGEFWIELSWLADPDGRLGIRRHYESPYRPGEKITLAEYYRWMFENTVPGLPEKAAAEKLTPLEYMLRRGVVEIPTDGHRLHEDAVERDADSAVRGAESAVTRRPDQTAHLPLTGCPDTVGALVDGVARRGFTRRRASSSRTRRAAPSGPGPSSPPRRTRAPTSTAR
jgi:hypothetical protein